MREKLSSLKRNKYKHMPAGVYKRTEQMRRSISAALKGRHISEEWKKKISQTLKGRKLSENIKRS